MTLAFIPSVGKYASDRYLWTDDELDAMEAHEREWRRGMRRPSFSSLIDTYPQAKPMMRRFLKGVIAGCEADMARAEEERGNLARRLADWKTDPDHAWFIEAFYAHFLIPSLEDGREKTMREARHCLSLISPRKKGIFDDENAVTVFGVDDARIARAREFPIESIVDVGRNRKALCVWHHEEHPSMHVFPDNHAWCFSCSRGGDAIAVAMAKDEIGFVEAVRLLAP